MIAKIKEVEERFPRLSEVIRFLIVGVVVNLIDMFIMSLIMYFPNKGDFGSYFNVFTMKGISPTWLTVLATSVGFLVGLVFNYIFSLWFVYDGENKNAKTKKGMILFAVLSVIGLCIQSFGMWLCCDLFHLNEWIIKIILIVIVLAFNYVTRKFFIFNDKETKEIDLVKIIKSEPEQSYSVSLRELLFNLGFTASAFFYSVCAFEDISDFAYNTVAKFVLAGVVVIMALFYLFIVDTKLISKTFEGIKNHKTEFVLSALATVFYEYIIFIEHPNLNALNIVFAVLSAFAIFVLFLMAYKFIVNKIKEFYKSLSKSEKIFILVTFIASMLLFFITLMFTGMFIGIPKEGWTYEVFSFDTGYLYDWNTFTNPFAFNNNIRHILFSYSFLPFMIIPYAVMNICKISFLFGIVIQVLNYFMMVVIIILLKRMLKINNLYTEIAFYLFTFLSSAFFINLICSEKFVIPVFFVILTLNAVMQKKASKYFYYFFALISLSTNILLFPIVFFSKDKTLKETLKELIVFAGFFVFAVLFCGQACHFLGVSGEVGGLLNGYGGKNFAVNMVHFFTLMTQFWVLPDMALRNGNVWATEPSVTSFFFIFGIILFWICLACFFVTRKNNFVKICFYWFIVVIIYVVILGWGVGANEVFLSALTYIWAFIPPLFMTLDKLIKNKKVLLGVVCALMLAVVVKNSITFVEIMQYAHSVLPTF